MDDSDDGGWWKTMMDGSPDDPKESQAAILMGKPNGGLQIVVLF